MALFVFSNPFLANQAVRAWELPGINADHIRDPYEVGVLLGGSLLFYDVQNNRPVYSQSVDRLLQTISLYKKGKIKKILLSGGSGTVSRPEEREADIMVDVLTKSGVPHSDIILERNSKNTYENAVHSAAILNQDFAGSKVILITSAFHMRRTVACFLKAGVTADIYPVDPKSHAQLYTPDQLIIPNAYAFLSWEMLFHEWIGMIMYKTAGYI
jgi:uncharacterized SAM-binding protein YcdF (DUF218 family)